MTTCLFFSFAATLKLTEMSLPIGYFLIQCWIGGEGGILAPPWLNSGNSMG